MLLELEGLWRHTVWKKTSSDPLVRAHTFYTLFSKAKIGVQGLNWNAAALSKGFNVSFPRLFHHVGTRSGWYLRFVGWGMVFYQPSLVSAYQNWRAHFEPVGFSVLSRGTGHQPRYWKMFWHQAIWTAVTCRSQTPAKCPGHYPSWKPPRLHQAAAFQSVVDGFWTTFQVQMPKQVGVGSWNILGWDMLRCLLLQRQNEVQIAQRHQCQCSISSSASCDSSPDRRQLQRCCRGRDLISTWKDAEPKQCPDLWKLFNDVWNRLYPIRPTTRILLGGV